MFLSKIQAAGDRSPYGDFWFEPVSVRTLSGMRVSPETAMQLSAVYRAVFLLSGHFAMLPMVLKQIGKLAPVKGHWLQKRFKKPNRWQNGFEWRMMLMGHLLLRGNAYNEIIEDRRGNVLELVPLHPDRVRIEMLANGDYRYRVTDADGNERILVRGQVWHLRGLSSNGIVGLSVIECARESLGLGLSAQAYGARFFANDAKPTGGWIEYPGNFADKEARRIFRESVQEAQADANRGKMMVLDRGMKYHEVGITNTDAQFLESRKFQISDIARWFGVPPHKLADLDRATFSNIEQQGLEYVTDSLMIWTENWENSIEDVFIFDDEDVEVDFDFKKLARGDSTARATNNTKLVAGGILTRNEARAEEGREPLPGLDEPLQPLNMAKASEAGEEEEEGEPEDGAGQQSAPKKGGGKDARLHALVASNAQHLARRFAKAGVTVGDAQLVADALAISRERAAGWCTFLEGANLCDDEQTLTDWLIRLGSTS